MVVTFVMYQLASATQYSLRFIVEAELQCLGKVSLEVVNT